MTATRAKKTFINTNNSTTTSLYQSQWSKCKQQTILAFS